MAMKGPELDRRGFLVAGAGVMAFAGVELTRRAYQTAIDERYRFYSYGDAMLIV